MPENIEDIVGRKAIEQIDELTNKLLKASALIEDINKKGRSIEIEVTGAKTISDTVTLMDKLSANTNELAVAQVDLTKTIRDTDTILKNYGTDMEQNIRVQLGYKNELRDVKESIKELNKVTDIYGNVTRGARDKIVDLIKKEQELKIAISENEQLIKAQAKANVANAGSIDQLSAKLGQYRDIFRQLSADERNSAVGEQLLKTVQELDPTIKAFDYSVGNFQRNVGNYGGSFSKAFQVLNTELTDTKNKLAGMSAGDSGFDQLKAKEAALEKTTKNLNKTFNSSKQELREFQEAAKQLGLTLGDDASAFTDFASEVGKSKDQISDLQSRVDFSASDTKYLDGTIQGINALAGVYGVAEGAATLLGISQEDLQAQMVKLQAILVITNGLQQIQQVVQSESAAIQTLLALQTKIYTAAKAVEAAINKVATTSLEANIAVTIKSKAAQVANTIATTAASSATALYTFVTNGATIATKLFRAAILATGLGAIVVLVVSLVNAMNDYGTSVSKAADDTRDFSKAYDEMTKTTENANNAIQRAAKVDIAAAKARGASAEELSKIEQEASSKRLRNLKFDQENNSKTLKASAVDSKEYIEALALDQKLREQIANEEAEVEVNKYDRIAESRKKSADEEKKSADERKRILAENKKNADALNYQIVKLRMSFLTPTDEEVKDALNDIQRIVDNNGGKVYLDAGVRVNLDNIKKDLDKVDNETNKKLLGVESAYNKGLYKNVKSYEADKLNIAIDGSQNRFQVEVDGLRKLLDFLPENSAERATIESKLQDAELKHLDETNQLKVDKAKDTEDKIFENKKRYKALINDLENETYDTAVFLVDALAQKRINDLDTELKSIERNKEIEILAINESTLSQVEKEQRIAEEEKRTQIKRDAIERQKIEVQRRAAVFDKAATIAKIIADTASAIVAQLKIGPEGIPLSIAVGLTGALQLAKAIAAPLPQYFQGTDSSVEGLAITDEKGAELYQEPTGEIYIGSNDGPTLRYLKGGTKITSHNDLMQMISYSMMMDRPVLQQYNEKSFDVSEMVDELKQTKKINKQMLKTMQKPSAQINNHNPGWDAYLHYLRN